MNKNKLILAFIALIVTASGCTDTGSGSSVSITQTQGISVQNFNLFPSEVPENQQAQLEVTLKNTGGQTAKNVEVEIFNIPLEGTQSWSLSGDNPITFPDLQPADERNNIPTSPVTQTVSLTAPDLQNNVAIPYDLYGDIRYEYKTVGISEIQLMSQDRYRATNAARTQPTVENTGGPIQLDIRTKSPIVFFQGTSTSPQFCVVVTNEGGGVPSLATSNGPGEEDKVELTVSSAGSLDIAPSSKEVTIASAGQGTGCFDISPGSLNQKQTTLPVTVEASYFYEKDAQTSITVQGQQ